MTETLLLDELQRRAEAIEPGTLLADTLQSLIDKSLVRPGETGRFFLLETTREFALEQFELSDEQHEIRARHARWYFDLGVTANGQGPDRVGARTRLRRRPVHRAACCSRAISRWRRALCWRPRSAQTLPRDFSARSCR